MRRTPSDHGKICPFDCVRRSHRTPAPFFGRLQMAAIGIEHIFHDRFQAEEGVRPGKMRVQLDRLQEERLGTEDTFDRVRLAPILLKNSARWSGAKEQISRKGPWARLIRGKRRF
jgi:hypothetical protein